MSFFKTRTAGIFLCLLLLTPDIAMAEGLALLRDEEIEQTLKAYGAPIFEQAGVSPNSVKFILVENDELNAFVAGGQNIFINTGLLMKSDNAAEVSGVIAHETGHIALGHLFRGRETMEDLSFQAILSSLLGIAVAVGTGSGKAGAAIGSAGQHAAVRNALAHTRTQESSADQAGIRFLKGSHLPISGFVSFMEKLANQELLPSTQQSEYVRTHPLTRDRIDSLSFAATETKKYTTPVYWNTLHGRMKAKLEGYLKPDRALISKDNSIDAQYARAIAWDRKGRLDKSLPLIDTLIKTEPNNPYFYELKAQMLFQGGRIEESVPVYENAVLLAPHSGLIRAAYAHALLESANGKRDRLTETVEQLQKSLNDDPRNPSTHHLLAVAYGSMGEEGMSRLNLAEKYALTGQANLAEKEALLALQTLPKNSPARLRAQDILDISARAKEKE